jgi:UrcA family protein
MKSLLATVLIGSSALIVTTHSVAAERMAFDEPQISKTISLRDLDLAEPSHLPIVYARVRQGATAVCDAAVRSERLMHRRAPAGWRDRCVREAVEQTVRSVQDQRLTALHSRSEALIANQQ